MALLAYIRVLFAACTPILCLASHVRAGEKNHAEPMLVLLFEGVSKLGLMFYRALVSNCVPGPCIQELCGP